MRYTQFAANLAVGGGRASLSDVNTRLYGGEFTGSVEIDTEGALPTLRLTGNARNLALDPLLTAMLGDANISGTGSFDLNLTGTGATIGDGQGVGTIIDDDDDVRGGVSAAATTASSSASSPMASLLLPLPPSSPRLACK